MTVSIMILIAALLTGVASDYLFYDSLTRYVPNGASVLLWSLMVSLAISVIAAVKKKEINSHCLWWLAPINLSAAAYMWRDSSMLHNIDVFLILFGLVMLSFSLKGNVAQASGISKYVDAYFATAVRFWRLFIFSKSMCPGVKSRLHRCGRRLPQFCVVS